MKDGEKYNPFQNSCASLMHKIRAEMGLDDLNIISFLKLVYMNPKHRGKSRTWPYNHLLEAI
ncbi:uncharacterized protein J3R85_016435 [Psidium guajava]|nr:uncharacterized protein J3R85_016435 [Psidium guajava]